MRRWFLPVPAGRLRVGNALALGRTPIVLQAGDAQSVQAVLVEQALPGQELFDRDAVSPACRRRPDRSGRRARRPTTSALRRLTQRLRLGGGRSSGVKGSPAGATTGRGLLVRSDIQNRSPE